MSEFSELLRGQMSAGGFSGRGLARNANSIGQQFEGWTPLHSDGDGIENWIRRRRIRRRIRPRYWMQLAAVAQVLELDEPEAQKLFTAAGHSLDGLRVKAASELQPLLDFGKVPLLAGVSSTVPPGKELVPTMQEMVPFRDAEMALVPVSQLRRSKMWAMAATTGLLGVACLSGVAMADVGPFSNDTVVSERNEIAASPVANTLEVADRDSPPLPPTPVGRSCVVDLSLQPSGVGYIGGQRPDECPEMMIWHQYAGYEGDDLLPWDEGVAQCYAAPPLVRMWVGFRLPDGTEGWLPLTPGQSGADIFKETRPAEPELREIAETTAPSVGKFDYTELAGNAFAVQVDLPVELDLSRADPNRGHYSLGGCWQEADRDGSRGLALFWPPGVNP